ncbi:MATE family efflux transporter [Tissierella creatinophila]|uniref:Multidrug export protein MepA n=1 Tax=Tissierella creatinophila DSM 6911 TaxID=1123403 RepID=A0A1U7M3M2_TISCR|nr:MATE family efflux transporter [Tissierella creatinophila]OLS01912.1 multidrug export protein MepA [Tissierella creatinophila DSM 6911]
MENKQQSELGTKNITKLLFSMAIPAIAAQIINLLYNMVDRMYIGHIPEVGATALTAVGVTMPIIMVISAFAALVSMGGAPRASIMMGKGDKDTAQKILGNCTTALVFISITLTAIVLIFGDKMLMAFGASENTIKYALDYLNIYAFGTLFVQLALGLNAFITAQGFAKISMLTVLVGAILNIILDPIFIFGFKMGVKGAALATIISQGVSALWVMKFLTGDKTLLKIKRKYLKIDFKVLLPCIALGLAPFIMQSTESILAIAFNTSLLKYGGDLAVGSMTILSSVMQFSMLPLVGLTQGATPIISFNYGAGNGDRVKDAFLLLLKISLAYSIGLWAITMIWPQLFAKMFTKDIELINITIKTLRIYMAASLLFGIQISCQQTFIALGNAKTSVFLAILRKIILLIPLIYILPLFLQNKVNAVFLAEPIADIIAVTVTGTLFTIQFKGVLRELDLEKI